MRQVREIKGTHYRDIKMNKIIDHNNPRTGTIIAQNTRTGSAVVQWHYGEVEFIDNCKLNSRWRLDRRAKRFEIIDTRGKNGNH